MPLRRLLRALKSEAPEPAAEGEAFAEAAGRFERWMAGADIDAAMERAARPGADLPEALASDAASWLGERLRAAHGGQWAEDPLFGLVVSAPGGIGHLRAAPLAMVERKWRLGPGLSLARFLETLPDRLAAESDAPPPPDREAPAETAGRLAGLSGLDATAAAAALANDFRKDWLRRHKAPVALSLQGVREADAFLRSQAFLCALDEAALARMGFFVGEVARGLFQGEWRFDACRGADGLARAALAWPELPYYPVGKVFKALLSAEDGTPFDEYIRLVPSARRELAKQAEE